MKIRIIDQNAGMFNFDYKSYCWDVFENSNCARMRLCLEQKRCFLNIKMHVDATENEVCRLLYEQKRYFNAIYSFFPCQAISN